MSDATRLMDALAARLVTLGRAAVAVSGGVDSMTLAAAAQRVLGERVAMIHATSAAVPPQASERVRARAARDGWRLDVIDAGEFDDPRYVANPVDRCFFCKTNLYAAMARHCDHTLLSGTNLDDLGDYRPGLRAAQEHAVRHPFVEAGIDKAGVRTLARMLDLGDIAELPAAPCLSSRVETGIAIDPRVLPVVNDVERLVGDALSPRTVRCRVRHEGVVVELDGESLARLDDGDARHLAAAIAGRFAGIGETRPVRFEAYRMGSAFVHAPPPDSVA